MPRLLFIFFILLFGTHSVYCQSQMVRSDRPYVDSKVRVLFILDASGSMREMVGNQRRFELAKDLLLELHDSIYKNRPDTEFALRVFGHRSGHDVSDCKDTALEIPFSKNNFRRFQNTLQGLAPRGWTPIAYSLSEAAKDFTGSKPDEKNVVILITDGLETCGGDPCEIAEIFERNRIAIRPFVIGMGLDEDQLINFDCVGPNLDASDPESFLAVKQKVVSYAIGETSLIINLLDKNDNATVSNLPFSVYDYYEKNLLNRFIHTISRRGNTDTIWLNPSGKYYVKVHSKPAIYSPAFRLNPGEHNEIDIPVKLGELFIYSPGSPQDMNHIQTIIKKIPEDETVYVQDFSTTENYLEGDYKIHILTMPVISKEISLKADEKKEISIERGGMVNLMNAEGIIAGLYHKDGKYKKLFWEELISINRITLLLQPGEYEIIYRHKDASTSYATNSQKFSVFSGGQVNLRL
ncbi:MAG: VWA domain-containing protein [Chitinophagaceae bacterium]|nr:MAG: VWA domain-containing protein [Chitinophagaceae bacterium]